METKRIKISDTKNINDEELKEAAQILRDGGLVERSTLQKADLPTTL